MLFFSFLKYNFVIEFFIKKKFSIFNVLSDFSEKKRGGKMKDNFQDKITFQKGEKMLKI